MFDLLILRGLVPSVPALWVCPKDSWFLRHPFMSSRSPAGVLVRAFAYKVSASRVCVKSGFGVVKWV